MTDELAPRAGRRDLTKYDPHKGVKTIAILEGIEKHYARAKDATQLTKAIRMKLEAQAAFVAWWDTQAEKDEGGRPSKTRSRSATGFTAGKDGMPERYVIERWRKRLGDSDAFETTYEQALARYVKILEFEANVHVAQNTGETEWFTPGEYIEAARRVLGTIDLDPASTAEANSIIKATRFYSVKDDGLAKAWTGRVWMNPPYAHPLIEDFTKQLAECVEAGSVTAAIALVNNATETGWFRRLADVASAVCFPEGRVKFWHPKKETAAPLQGQAVLYFGTARDAFCAQFESFGVVWVKP